MGADAASDPVISISPNGKRQSYLHPNRSRVKFVSPSWKGFGDPELTITVVPPAYELPGFSESADMNGTDDEIFHATEVGAQRNLDLI